MKDLMKWEILDTQRMGLARSHSFEMYVECVTSETEGRHVLGVDMWWRYVWVAQTAKYFDDR